MCGLVAAITKQPNGFSKDLVDAYNALLYIDSLRGMDSTGSILIENNGDVSWNKEATTSPLFTQLPEHRKQLNEAFQRGRALVGHNRAATRGVINDENAHPFTVDNRITLVHNGTLTGDHRKLADVDVDSHAIAHVIHENDGDVEKAIKQINGAYALIWHDFEKETLSFLRNDQRPLFFVEVEHGYLWASEANFLAWVLARFPNLKPTKDGINQLKAGTLVTYDFSNKSWSLDTKEIDIKPASTPLTSYGSRGAFYGYGGNHGTHRYASWSNDDYDDDTVPFSGSGRPTCALPAPAATQAGFVPKQTSTNIVATAGTKATRSSRVENEEQKIARDNKYDMACQTFMATQEIFKTGDTVVCTAHDYQYVANGDSSGGYFLYGRLHRDSNYMVKIHVGANISEEVLLDLTINGRKFSGTINGRVYSAYRDPADGRGYAMINTYNFKRVFDDTETVEEGAVNA